MGRSEYQTLSVNQQASIGYGANYPFVSPPDSVKYLLGDLWLSYEDDTCSYVLPLQVTKMTGFDSSSGAKDMIITDAEGTVVFDTTTATVRSANPWGAHLITLTWTAGQLTLRATMRTAPPPFDADLVWEATIMPAAVLDARTYSRLPRRVRSLIVNNQTLTAAKIVLQEGYNIQLTETDPTPIDGSRLVHQITMRGRAGDGQGVAPNNCGDVPQPILRINTISPTLGGAFTLQLSDCYRVQIPATGTPPAVSITTPSTLQLYNDCGPCCSCDDFVNTYEGIRKLFYRYQTIGQTAEATRDLFAANIARWNAQKTCREAASLNMVLNAESASTLFVGTMWCNVTGGCAVPVVLRTTFEYFADGEAVDPSQVVTTPLCKESKRTGTDTQGVETAYQPIINWPVVDTYFDYANAGSSSSSRNRYEILPIEAFEDVKEMLNISETLTESPATVRVTLSVHYPPIFTADGQSVSIPNPQDVSGNIPNYSTIKAIWDSTSQPPYPLRGITQLTAPISSTAGCCQ